MQSYSTLQRGLIKRIEEGFIKGESPSTIVTPVKDYATDIRVCLAGVVFLPKDIEEKIISEVINPLREADPRQYYYVPSSFHITIQNVRTIENPPLFTDSDIKKSRDVFSKIIPQFKPISFSLESIFQLPTSLSICAFTDSFLGSLAKELRSKLAEAGVPDNKKYADNDIVIANSTFCRFQTKPNEEFLSKVNHLKNIHIGEFEANKVELVTTNCVCIPTMTKIISTVEFRK